MMLFKLSLKNIKKSFKDYLIYFFTLILGVAIFYVFNSIDGQNIMLTMSKSTSQAFHMINNVLSSVSVFVSFVLGFLIIYASSFLMKRRNREFGIYMTLGMSKGRISKILFFETLSIGAISLVIGLGIGIALSQIMSIVVANMFDADMSKFTFTFSSSAMVKTIIYFGIMHIIVMIFSTIQVSRCKLIDLIQADKKSEKVKMKNPYLCVIVFLFSTVLLGYAYYNVTTGASNLVEFSDVSKQIIYGVVGTFLIFWSLSGFILKAVMSMKNSYYKKLNSFTIRQFSSKINTMVFSMTVICLMLFLTICIFSSAVSVNTATKENLRHNVPVDIQIQKRADLSTTDADVDGNPYTEGKIEDSKISIGETLTKMNFDVKDNFKDVFEFYSYKIEEITLKDTLGNAFSSIKEIFPDLYFSDLQELVKISDYNEMAKLYGLTQYEIGDNEYMILCNYDNMVNIRNEALKTGATITIDNHKYTPKFDHCEDGFITMTSEKMNMGIILVPDNAVSKAMKNRSYLIANYNATNKVDKQKIEDKILDLHSNSYAPNSGLYINTKISINDRSICRAAMAVFLGIYLGIVFLISSAAILALKELSECSDNIKRYSILRRLGADERMINKSIFKQIGVFFAFPLVLAVIHSIFGIQVSNLILQTFRKANILPSIIMTAGFLIVIYGGYFIITYLCCKNIIKED
ncbi:ABC transporter permease [Clostridium sp. UBA5119]|uniref:ABC transporter permease n=1 Tax=Clostridium sp. UBA5119 TaxID=1946366 RepID=UPI00321723CA